MRSGSPGMGRKRISTPAGGSSAAKELGEKGRDVCRHKEQKCLFLFNQRIGSVGWSCCVPTFKPVGSEWHFPVLMTMEHGWQREEVEQGHKGGCCHILVMVLMWKVTEKWPEPASRSFFSYHCSCMFTE